MARKDESKYAMGSAVWEGTRPRCDELPFGPATAGAAAEDWLMRLSRRKLRSCTLKHSKRAAVWRATVERGSWRPRKRVSRGNGRVARNLIPHAMEAAIHSKWRVMISFLLRARPGAAAGSRAATWHC
jgi:hypothetical protein